MAQKQKGGLVPLAKPSYKIDSLLTVAIAWDYSHGSISPDSLFYEVDINGSGGDSAIFIDINTYEKSMIHFILANPNKYVGYFKFKGHIVFLSSSLTNTDLFNCTRKLKRFDFLDLSPKKPGVTDALKLIQSLPAMYRYKNGTITSYDYGEMR